MTRVAMFTTYAPSEGFGGPARAFNQRRALEAAGHPVTHVVLQSNADRGDTRGTDLVELVERPYRARVDHIYGDVDLNERASHDARLIRRVTDHLQRQGTEAIILEQPFLVGVVAQVAATLGLPVVYSCQNIEYRLRADLERFVPDRHRDPGRSQHVRDLEAAAVDLSVQITAICPTDQEQIRAEFGRDSTLVPNGSTVSSVPLRPDLSVRPRKPYFAFAGSSYWPNVEGFVEVATPSLAFMPPTMRIDVAGSVGAEIFRERAVNRRHSINASRIHLRGFLPMDDLVEMMYRARSVIVPVFVGEGSNLKSADALAAGTPVIMTERATRGYEDVIARDSEGVTVVESAEGFRQAMTVAIRSPRPEGPIGVERRAHLTWSRRLGPLVTLIASLNGEQTHA